MIDKPNLSLSSKVAAGIWNPVVFKRLTKSWLADEVVPALLTFYNEAEKTLECSFLEEKKLVKLFTEEQEIALWKKKAAGEMASYLDPVTFTIQEPIKSEAGIVLKTGNIDTLKFILAGKAYFIKNNGFIEEQFSFNHLSVNNEKISYKENSAGSIIFCEGHLMRENPYFSHIPLKPAKGDILTIKCEKLNTDFILNKGMFVMPLGDHLYKVGATYDWNDLNDIPGEAGKNELVDKLSRILPYPYEIVKHEAGVRPSTIDRRPVIGKHPVYENIQIFNGFGTKAVMLAPYFAKQFVAYLKDEGDPDTEVNCRRFGIKS